MSDVVVIPAGAGEVVGDAPDRRVEVLSDHPSLNATWSRFGPGRDGADLHVHHSHSDFFYVLEGRLTLRLGVEDELVEVPAGTLARVPPLVVHGFRNGPEAEVRYLNFHAPGRGFADYLRAIRDRRELSYDQHEPPTDGGRPVSEAAVGEVAFAAEAPGLRMDLLADVGELGIAEVRLDSGRAAPPPHVHLAHAESFYVLEGELAFVADGGELRAEAGSWVQVPPGVRHTCSAAAEARFLNLHTPSCGFGAFVRALHHARTDDERAAARAAFDQLPTEPPGL